MSNSRDYGTAGASSDMTKAQVVRAARRAKRDYVALHKFAHEAGAHAAALAGPGSAVYEAYRDAVDKVLLHGRPPVADPVNHPPHYQTASGLEAITVIESFGLNFYRGNAVKYALRAGKKGALVEDLRKAIWYLEREIAALTKPSPAETMTAKIDAAIAAGGGTVMLTQQELTASLKARTAAAKRKAGAR